MKICIELDVNMLLEIFILLIILTMFYFSGKEQYGSKKAGVAHAIIMFIIAFMFVSILFAMKYSFSQ